MSFEKDEQALNQALEQTNSRIIKLEKHKKTAQNQSNSNSKETIRRLERNLEKLYKKRELIHKELKSFSK